MPELLYVPVLPVKPHAARAFASLLPVDRRSAAPLWTLPPQEEGTLRELPESALKDVARSQRFSRGAWLDLPFAWDVTEPVAARLKALWTVGSLVPVTAPERTPRLRELALASARSSLGSGRIGVRIGMPGRWDETRLDDVGKMIAEIERTTGSGDDPTRMDLLLDLGTVLDDRADAGKEALLALDALVPLAPWRCVAVLSGASAKRPISDLPPGGIDYGSRHDWTLWHDIRNAAREYSGRVLYGDYGALPAGDVAMKPRKSGSGGAPWGAIRYTTDSEFLYTKCLTGGDGHHESIRAAARQILAGPAYRGRDDGWSHTWLEGCANGTGGVGNAETWNRVSNHQHFTYVIRALTH